MTCVGPAQVGTHPPGRQDSAHVDRDCSSPVFTQTSGVISYLFSYGVSEYPPGSINTLFWLGFPQSKLVSSVPGCSTGLGGSINTLFWLGFPQSKLVSSVPGCSTGLGGSINTPHPAILFVFVVLNSIPV
jgi:hypothetical protein